jgi:hypothetical protein
MTDTYVTTDLYLTAYLKVKGFKCRVVKQGNKSRFVFDNSVSLILHVDEYLTESGSCEPLAFTNAIKNLKTLLHNNK